MFSWWCICWCVRALRRSHAKCACRLINQQDRMFPVSAYPSICTPISIHSFCPHGSGPGVVSVSRIMIWKKRKREEEKGNEGRVAPRLVIAFTTPYCHFLLSIRFVHPNHLLLPGIPRRPCIPSLTDTSIHTQDPPSSSLGCCIKSKGII